MFERRRVKSFGFEMFLLPSHYFTRWYDVDNIIESSVYQCPLLPHFMRNGKVQSTNIEDREGEGVILE